MVHIPKKINLLFVGDSIASVEDTIYALEKDNLIKFNVTRCESLKAGIDMLNVRHDFDVILLDLLLPNSKGVDTYTALSEVCNSIPIVIISAYEEEACNCVKLGAQDFLLKPVNQGVLTRSLKYAIERRKLEAEAKNIVNSSTLGYLIYEYKDGKLIFSGYNPMCNEILGVDCGMFMGKEINDAFPKLPPEVPENFMIAATKGIPYQNQTIKYEDDNVRPAFYRFNAYQTSENRIAVTFEDVTFKVEMEKVLRESEQHYRTLVEATNASIYEIDFLNDKFTYVNDVMCEKLGYTKEELMNIPPTKMLTDEAIKSWAERWELLNKGEFIDKTFEYEGRRKDGEPFWTLITAEYKEDENGLVIGARVVAIDITEQKKAKYKEKLILQELENRIHQWQEELSNETVSQQNKIKSIGLDIKQSLTNGIEVS
jgi:PAS domain S-box-containing protein